jgi:3-hydroxy-D-aspartate aldolase
MPLPTSQDSMIGRPYTELDTPALCVRLEGMEANIAAMASFLKEHGKQWRPHAKGHKCPEIARRLLAAGAIGVTVAKSSEAMVFARHGVRDILIANMIVGEPKLARVVELTQIADPIVAVDHFVHAEMLDDACRRAGVRCRVVAEVNVGFHRVGVRPGADTRDLTRGISRLKNIDLVGLMGYEGHLLALPDPVEKEVAIRSAMAILGEARVQMLADGICCDIVSAGGTGSYQVSARCPEPTELQAGSGVFGDPFYSERCGASGLTSALFVLASVVSRGKLERAVLDSGRKSISQDIHPPRVSRIAGGRPLPSVEITMLSAEHLRAELGEDSNDLRIGDKVEVIPGYSDFTILLHDAIFALRNDRVAHIWPIEARGCLQ